MRWFRVVSLGQFLGPRLDRLRAPSAKGPVQHELWTAIPFVLHISYESVAI